MIEMKGRIPRLVLTALSLLIITVGLVSLANVPNVVNNIPLLSYFIAYTIHFLYCLIGVCLFYYSRDDKNWI